MLLRAYCHFGKILWGAIAVTGVISGCRNMQSMPMHNSEPIANPVSQPNMTHGAMMDHAFMALGPADENFDLRFIDAMIPHHEGAVIMAQEVLKKSQRPELLKLAEAIIKAQDQEINQMKEWRRSWYPKMDDTPMAWHGPMNHMMAMSPEQRSQMHMSIYLGAADADFDRRFLEAMIPHHEGAIVMAKEVLEKSKRPEIKTLAERIIASQQAEIDQMNQWLKEWSVPR